MHNAISISLDLFVTHALGTRQQHGLNWYLLSVVAELG